MPHPLFRRPRGIRSLPRRNATGGKGRRARLCEFHGPCLRLCILARGLHPGGPLCTCTLPRIKARDCRPAPKPAAHCRRRSLCRKYQGRKRTHDCAGPRRLPAGPWRLRALLAEQQAHAPHRTSPRNGRRTLLCRPPAATDGYAGKIHIPQGLLEKCRPALERQQEPHPGNPILERHSRRRFQAGA